jgi:hypothetical protein
MRFWLTFFCSVAVLRTPFVLSPLSFLERVFMCNILPFEVPLKMLPIVVFFVRSNFRVFIPIISAQYP